MPTACGDGAEAAMFQNLVPDYFRGSTCSERPEDTGAASDLLE
jgi:hypothetical protein